MRGYSNVLSFLEKIFNNLSNIQPYLLSSVNRTDSYKTDDPPKNRMVDRDRLGVIIDKLMVGLMAQSPPEPHYVSELQGNIKHRVLISLVSKD